MGCSVSLFRQLQNVSVNRLHITTFIATQSLIPGLPQPIFRRMCVFPFKTKWRRLRYLDFLSLHRMPDVIMTACCLHNFIIQCREDEEEDQWDEDMEQNDEDEGKWSLI